MRKGIARVALLSFFAAFPGMLLLAENVDTDRFHLEFPEWCGSITKKEQTVDSPSGPIRQVTYVGMADSGAACILTFSQLKASINDPAAMMKGGRDSLIRSLKASLESERSLTIAGQPGMTLSFSANQQRPIFARTDLVVRDDRMYQIIFLGYSDEERQRGAASSLFSSFRLKPGGADAPRRASSTQ